MSFNDLLMTFSTEFLRLLNPGHGPGQWFMSRAIGTYVDMRTGLLADYLAPFQTGGGENYAHYIL